MASALLPVRFSRLRAVIAIVAAVFLGVPSAARAGETLNVQDWLARPGVRLVAVEFYATWCEPCMKAMPRWKALKEKYGPEGLRVIVVNTQDPDGGCRALPFVPDESVCDLEGHVADAFKLQGKLPSAYLWSWQGNLLVSKGHIDEVEKAVEAYVQAAPRVVVEAAADLDASLVTLVRDRLADDGKVQVLAGAAELAAIDAAKRAQQGARYDERLQCELGKEIPPNTLLKLSRVSQGEGRYLNLGLYDLTGGCLLASASSAWTTDARRMTQDVTGKLLAKLKRPEGMQSPVARVVERADGASSRDGAWRRTAGWWTLGTGAALLATGATFAVMAKATGDDLNATYKDCATTGRCARKEELDEADRQSLLGNVGLFGGAAVAALGTYFVVTAPSVEPLRGLRVDVGPRYLGVGGSF
jgi:thiol-disulfide isomerase/thioredoxin